MTDLDTMDRENQGICFPDAPLLDALLERAKHFFVKDKLTKPLLVFVQSPAIYYAGAAVRQCGKSMKAQEVWLNAALSLRDVGAPGILQFLVESKHFDLPRGLTRQTMGRTKMTDDAKGFFNTNSKATYRRYEEQRRVCKGISQAWERVKPSGGKIPSGQQHGDVLQALCLHLWETEQAAKTPRKKPEVISVVDTCASGPATPVASQGLAGGEAAAGPAPLAGVDPNTPVGRTQRVSQGGDEAPAPMPSYWVPSFMLTWVLWGPLSDTPDGDFALESSSGPDGCDAGEAGGGCDEDRKPSLIGSKGGIKMLAPMSTGLSREKRKALERQEKARNQKENGDTMFEKMWKENNDLVAKVMDTLKVLFDDIHGNRRAEEHKESLALRQEALRNLKEELEIARDEGDEDEVRAITKRRKKLLRTPPVSVRRDYNIVNGVIVGETAGPGGRGFDGANGAGVIGASSDGVVGGRSGSGMDGVVISGMEEDGVPASGGGDGGVGVSGTDADGADGGDVYGNGVMGAGVGGSEFGGSGTGVDEAGGGVGDGNGAVGAGVGGGGVGCSGTGVDEPGGGAGHGNDAVGAGVSGGELGGSGTKTDEAAGGDGGRNGVVDAGVGGGGEAWPMVTGTNGAGSGGSTSGTNGGKGKGVEDVDSDDDEDLSDAIFETFGVRTLSEVARGAAKKSESESVIDVEM